MTIELARPSHPSETTDLPIELLASPLERRSTVSLVIPAKNEARNLPHVLENLPACLDEIILVDGRSRDVSRMAAQASRPDIQIIGQPRPGKGSALRAGFEAARGDLIVAMDADGSMDPGEIPRFIYFLENGYDFVKGSRFVAGGGSLDITPIRRLGNRGLLLTANLLFGIRWTDLCYGFFGFRRCYLDHLNLQSDGFEIETEVTVRASLAGLRLAEIPSLEHPRRSGQSNLRTFHDGQRVLKTLFEEHARHQHSGARRSRLQSAPLIPPDSVDRRRAVHALVTGGAGFIGSNLVDRLIEAGHSVDVVDNLATGSLDNLSRASHQPSRFTFFRLDVVTDDLTDLCRRRRPDVIFHLAAQASVVVSTDEPAHDATVNIVGTLRVLEAAKAAGVRKIVYAASGGTLYLEPDAEDLPLTEMAPRGQSSPYGISKAVVLSYLDFYRRTAGLEYAALALANVYGPRQDPHGEAGVIAIFASRALGGEPLHVYGDGNQTRDFVFVGDVTEVFVLAAAGGNLGVINIGTGVETSVTTIAETLRSQAGVDVPIEYHAPRPGELQRSALAPQRAESVLGWHASTPLESGIRAVIEALGSPLAA